MTTALAAMLVAAGLLLWPAPSRAQRRLGGLRHRGRLPARGAAAAHVASASVPPGAPVGPGGRRPAVGAPVLALALVAGAVVVLGAAHGVAAAASVFTVAAPVRAGLRARRRARFDADLGTALAVLHGELRAGTPAAAALAVATERAGAAAAVLRLDPTAGPEARSLAAAAGVVAATGAAWADVVDGVVRDVTARVGRRREIGAALAGVRASMLLLAALPLLGVLLAAGTGAHPVAFLLGRPAGGALLAAGALLQLAGVAATLTLVRRAAR